eukprot:5281336-Pyramimonas_sp.AAC.2
MYLLLRLPHGSTGSRGASRGPPRTWTGGKTCVATSNPGRLTDKNVVEELSQLGFTGIRARALSHA